jgi:quinol monooxygenase YgiN
MILVTGTITARPDTIAEMTREALVHVQRSRTEPGCISHDVAVDPANPLRLIFLERWDSADALRAHFKVPASRAFWRRLQDLAAEPGAMQLYEANRIAL